LATFFASGKAQEGRITIVRVGDLPILMGVPDYPTKPLVGDGQIEVQASWDRPPKILREVFVYDET
jgi:hypothetical protein